MVALGNSITHGAGLGAGQDYPSILVAALGSGWQVFNSGHDGETTQQLLDNFTDYAGIRLVSGSVPNILVVNEVGNDIVLGADEATALSNMQALIAHARSHGWTVCFATTTPRTSFNSEQQTAASNINQFFRDNPSEHDGLIDWAADPRLADPDDATYYQDGVHPTAAGAAVIAELTLSAITTLL